MTNQDWNAELYQSAHDYVWKRGDGVLELLQPKAGERVLDVGCGTGQLTAQLAAMGVDVLGVDSSAAMIKAARVNYPDLAFEVEDAATMEYRGEFSAVFSNAALHWVTNPGGAIRGMRSALQPGGRLVLEMGGQGNIHVILSSIQEVFKFLDVAAPSPWKSFYFPSVSEYTTLLERMGFQVRSAELFDRPTALEGGTQGLRNWVQQFQPHNLELLRPDQQEVFFRLVEEKCRKRLFAEGIWHADYRRLRIVAFAV